MGKMAGILFLLLRICSSIQSEPLSLYDYLVCLSQLLQSYHDLNITTKTGDGIIGGVEANGPEFKVNGKPLRLLSGSLHYFRFSLSSKFPHNEHLLQGVPRLLAN